MIPEAIPIPLQSEGGEFDLSDENECMEKMYSKFTSETLMLSLLEKLSDREKIFLLYQVMSLFGFSISQERFAKTLGISRIGYIKKLSSLKNKIKIYLRSEK